MLGVYSPHYETDTVQRRFFVAWNQKKIEQTKLKMALPLQKAIPKWKKDGAVNECKKSIYPAFPK